MAYVSAADVPAGSAAASKASILALIRDSYSIKSVADLTERAQAVTDWPTRTGAAISASNPVIVWRQDTDAIEVSEDGTTWVTFTGGDTGWVNLTPTAGTTVYETLSYRRLNGVTYLRGQVRATDGSWETSGQAVTTLPAGMRPAGDMSFPTPVSGDSGAYMRVTTAGVVTFYVGSGATGSYPNLGHISFPVG